MDNKILIRSESFRNAFEAINGRLVKKYSNYLNFKIKKKVFLYMCLFLQNSSFGDKFCFKNGYDHPAPLRQWYDIELQNNPFINTCISDSAYFDCLRNGSWYVHPTTGKEYSNYLGCRNFQNVLTVSIKPHVLLYCFGVNNCFRKLSAVFLMFINELWRR